MSLRSRARRGRREAPELDVTAFLNLMVILIPFLLLTAVFSHLTILELNLPPDSKQQPKDKPKKVLNFEIIVRANHIDVGDTIKGLIKRIEKVNGKHDFKALSKILKAIKIRFPTKQNITILMEPDVPYEDMVHAMDTARVITVVENLEVIKKELFPLIAIGDAP